MATSWYKLESTAVIGLVGGISKFWLKCLNSLRCYNMETLEQLAEHRPLATPLVTVSNHHSCLDDPMLWGMMKMRILLDNRKIRWTLGAKELLFSKPFHSFFFSRGKIIPIMRGEGVYQKGMDFAIEELNSGQWVHVFPEAGIIEDHSLVRLKWGVGRLIAESSVTPVVLPFWHVGMDDILPNKTPYIPTIMKRVTVLIGEPMYFDDILKDFKRRRLNAMETRKNITDCIQERFKELKEEAEKLHEKWR
ncbi:predicted protein [Nematostella vectensis]|uniref:Tafazzin family protein n=1 Tax=Nematostella vectensis TaxID=45351 RepID=A7S7Q8_NEMVE|nr:predicted protein [Nematostella vectensis]|eukprot:XP_001632342.1 predicted protein [Nematostella vectensis]